jgi:uncharacterized protein with FMN-binding domain
MSGSMKLKKPLVAIAFGIAAIFLAGVGVKIKLENNLKVLAKADIEEVDLRTITDGEYLGRFSTFPIKVELKVKVRNHKIEGVDLVKHINGQGKPAEAILAKIVQEQKISLEAISGATYSNKAILKAVSNALEK